jgi:tyrosinase
MTALSRRAFLAGAAAIPFAVWLERTGFAQTTAVRYDLRSAQGQKMLATYARAVGRMQDAIEAGDPRSWVFQWYTHFTKGSTTKSAEIARLYPEPSAWRDLAVAMWNTCQAHSRGQVEDYFLPWHRMFVYFFESIVRAVAEDDTFTLPYWNYSTCDAALRGVLPTEFRLPDDPLYEPLFVDKRNPGVNDGVPIQEGEPGDPLSLDALEECIYESDDAVQGFNLALDSGLHGNIHVLVGGSQNMGAVPWAAGDPIFWMHHCNIDRLWASWNAGGRQNLADPDFLAQTFVFADADGQRVVAKIGDFLAIAPLGYAYDHLEPVPPCPPAEETLEPLVLHAASAGPIRLGQRATAVALASPPGAESEPLAVRVEQVEEDRRLLLVLRGLATQLQPGVLYHVYLQLPAGADGQPAEEHLVGSINFFDAEEHAEHGGGEGHGAGHAEGAPPDKFYSFDVTTLAKRLAAAGTLPGAPIVTIAPANDPNAEAQPVVGEIRLVEQ